MTKVLPLDPSDSLTTLEAEEKAPRRRQVAALAHPPRVEDELRRVLTQLRTAREELRAGYRDVARREHAWRSFRHLAEDPLWDAVEDPEGDRWRRQLADVLHAAVTRIDAFQLEERHFAAIDLTLSRLSAPVVTEDDVHGCEDAWRDVGVDTIPSLKEAFQEWLACSDLEIDDAG